MLNNNPGFPQILPCLPHVYQVPDGNTILFEPSFYPLFSSASQQQHQPAGAMDEIAYSDFMAEASAGRISDVSIKGQEIEHNRLSYILLPSLHYHLGDIGSPLLQSPCLLFL